MGEAEWRGVRTLNGAQQKRVEEFPASEIWEMERAEDGKGPRRGVSPGPKCQAGHVVDELAGGGEDDGFNHHF